MGRPASPSPLLSFSPVSHRAAASLPAAVPACRPDRPSRLRRSLIAAVPAPAACPPRETTRRQARQPRQTLPTHPSQLLDWLRLASRQLFGADLAARLEPYSACRCCVSQVRWCGEGVP